MVNSEEKGTVIFELGTDVWEVANGLKRSSSVRGLLDRLGQLEWEWEEERKKWNSSPFPTAERTSREYWKPSVKCNAAMTSDPSNVSFHPRNQKEVKNVWGGEESGRFFCGKRAKSNWNTFASRILNIQNRNLDQVAAHLAHLPKSTETDRLKCLAILISSM